MAAHSTHAAILRDAAYGGSQDEVASKFVHDVRDLGET
jgi:hypothetical protein